MARFPEVQHRAQAELDRVVGPTRFPELEDMEKLPYVIAVVLEILRWRPVAPFGLPHKNTTEDVYEGYYISKGTMLIPVSVTLQAANETYKLL